MVKRNIPVITSVSFFESLVFFTPVLTLFLLDRGLDYAEIFLFGAISSLSQSLLEIPSGIFADLIGRRIAIIISNFLLLAFAVTLSVANSFWIFAFATALWGAANAMGSGSSEALVYDTLVETRVEDTAKKVYGRMEAAAYAAILIALTAGSLIASRYGLAASVNLTIPALAVAFVMTFALLEPRKSRDSASPLTYRRLMGEASGVLKNPRTRRVVLNYSVVVVAADTIMHLSQPHFLLSKIDVAYFGPIMALAFGLSAIFSLLAQPFERRLGVGWSSWLTAVIPGVLFFLMSGIYEAWFSSLSMVLILAFSSLRRPLFADYRNRLFRPESRATAISVVAFVTALVGILVKPALGYVADLGLSYAFLMVGVILVLSASLLRIDAKTVAAS